MASGENRAGRAMNGKLYENNTEINPGVIMSCVYSVLTTLGLLGNGFVIGMIVRILWRRRMVIGVYLYVLCLSAVDFAFLAATPFTIAFMVTGNWSYGSALCKLNYLCEGLNKTASVYLLVILSADRYLAVCKPTTSARYRSIKASLMALVVLFVCVLLTNVPIYKYTKATYDMDTDTSQCGIQFPKFNASGDDADPWNHFGGYYTLLLLVCYYVAPAGLICCFYIKLLGRLRQRYRTLHKRLSTNRRKRLTTSIVAVVAFYFCCWSPYWALQMILLYFPDLIADTNDGSNTWFEYVVHTVYAMPYVNSSVDPILYAFLNKRLLKAYADTRSAGRRRADPTDDERSYPMTNLRPYHAPQCRRCQHSPSHNN